MTLYPLVFLLDSSLLLLCGIYLALITVVGFFIYIMRKTTSNEKNGALNKVLDSLEDFTPTDSVKSRDLANFYFFAVDDDRDKVFFYNEKTHWLFNYHNIVSVSIRLGDYELLPGSGPGLLGGALLGGMAAGGLGAVLGGALGGAGSATRKRVEGVKSIVVHVELRDMMDPKDRSLDIVCYDTKQKEGTANEGKLQYCYSQAEKIEKLLTNAIEQVKESERQPAEKRRTTSLRKQSLTDELKELSRMKEEGLLSEEEFSKAKEKLLS